MALPFFCGNVVHMKQEFIETVWSYYDSHKRVFPWRETTDPYCIFVSEVMLQQTQTSRVVAKYLEFINAFPTVDALAHASFTQVLSLWSGLGYNRRAKYLHEAAKIISLKYKGVIPQDIAVLDELPGIGVNTASAIIVYSFNSPHVFIETNIRRIFIHHFFSDQMDVSDQELLPLIENTLDRKNPREWYWALMDYGSHLVKIVENPNRKSRHYTRQSRFEGSVRQVRGVILRSLIQGPLAENVLRVQAIADDDLFDKAIESLLTDGLLLRKNGILRLE